MENGEEIKDERTGVRGRMRGEEDGKIVDSWERKQCGDAIDSV